jgi:hypothetical protein
MRLHPREAATGILLRLLSALAALSVLSGCAGYRLGPTNGLQAGSRTVQFKPFTNQTLQPRLGDAVDTALRIDLQRDGTYRLATREDADIVVSGVITRYARHELSLVPTDVLTVQDFRVSMTAHVTARERASGKVLFNSPVTGSALVRVGADLSSGERQALSQIADDFAKKVISLLADGTW